MLRQGKVTPAICIPWRGGDWQRERNLEFVQRWFAPLGLPVFTADADPSQTFNRGASRNAAVEMAAGHDPLFIADADCVCSLDVVRHGFDVARETGRMVICHDDFWRLSEKGTQRLVDRLDYYRQNPKDVIKLTDETRLQGSQMPSGGLAITQASFDRIGGYADIRFWGFEDSVWLIEAKETVGVVRLKGPMWHLHHKRETGTIADREVARVIAEQHLAERRAGRV